MEVGPIRSRIAHATLHPDPATGLHLAVVPVDDPDAEIRREHLLAECFFDGSKVHERCLQQAAASRKRGSEYTAAAARIWHGLLPEVGGCRYLLYAEPVRLRIRQATLLKDAAEACEERALAYEEATRRFESGEWSTDFP